MKLDGYETYCLFIALKNHFTQKSYDFLKYHGKTRVSKETFTTSKDRFKYMKLSRKYDALEMRDFIIANLLANKNWIGEMLDDDADDIYKAYIKRKQSLSYNFTNEIDKLFTTAGGPEKAFKIKNNQYPDLLNLYLQNEISIETVAILNTFVDFVSKFDEKLGKDDVIWSKTRLLISKLTPFLDYDREKVKKILKTNINNSSHKEDTSLEKT